MNRWFCTFVFGLLLVPIVACDRSSDVDGGTDASPSESEPRDRQNSQKAKQVESTVPAPEPKLAFNRDVAIEASEKLARQGKVVEASGQLQSILLVDPEDVEVRFRLARLQADRGDLRSAVELLDSIPADHPEAGIPALGQAADWYMKLEDYDEAEDRYLKVLDRVGSVAVAHRALAYLYNRQGRRHEAAVHLRALCRLGDIQQDELHALMVLGHAIFTDPNQPATGPRPYYPIGPMAKARMLYTANRYVEAIEALDELVQSGEAKSSTLAFYGLLAIEAQDVERFQWWLARADDSVQEFAEYWSAVGAYLLGERRFEEAVRALGEALDRDPTNVGAMRRISQALTALGKTEEADRWMDRYVTQRDVTLASNAIGESQVPSLDSYDTVVEGLAKIQRPLESMTWRLFEAFYRKLPREQIESLNQQRAALLNSGSAFPSQLDRVCGLDLKAYPLPDLEIGDPATVKLAPSIAADLDDYPVPVFSNIATEVGLNHTYQIASQPQPFRFALYQSLGGGIAVLDYDLDGVPEFYLAQGSGDPPSLVGQFSNLLYRQQDGRLQDVSQVSGVVDNRYSIGVTSGDWNQDGFDDLVVGNIGGKVLLVNNGDGTFRSVEFDTDQGMGVLTSSFALGDLSGDAIPDLYSLYYVEDEAMLNRPKVGADGNILTVSPASFTPGIDRMAINDGRGGMEIKKISESSADASTGLGVVVADWDEKPGNDVFVGNDVRPNQLWVRSPETQDWSDIAAITGCAHGVGGTETASMGIAVADFDGNGTRDIHITNFYLEPVSLFMNRGGTFEDRCIHYRLNRDSSTVLGFGCQAVDYNNDGRPDLVVTNGNIEKAPGEPLEQSPQFFVNLGDRFKLLEVKDESGYWQGKYLGRGMAKLDFNQDGRQDIVITHLGSPTSLIANQTNDANHWLAVQLSGVESERGAIGAKVEARVGDRVLTGWIVGGDGYLCRNEPVVLFGIGEATKVENVVVTWPSGRSQEIKALPADSRVLVIEGEPDGFLFD